VHCITVNDYLARRDSEWMGQIYRALGLSVGLIQHSSSDAERQAAYGSDVTYGTNNEYGFDYLRDNMKYSLESYVQQRGHNFGIVDEVDSILIDEARTPSSSAVRPRNRRTCITASTRSSRASRRRPTSSSTRRRRPSRSPRRGSRRPRKALGITNLYDPVNMDVLHYVSQGLRAPRCSARRRLT